MESIQENEAWRITHLGRLLGLASARFDERVWALMARDRDLPLALGNLVQRRQVGAAHIHLTRHLPLAGARLVDLAKQAGMSKQAMGSLVNQCEAWGLVRREGDEYDARAKCVVFTPSGLLWLAAFHRAVAQAEVECEHALGKPFYAVLRMGLEAYVQA